MIITLHTGGRCTNHQQDDQCIVRGTISHDFGRQFNLRCQLSALEAVSFHIRNRHRLPHNYIETEFNVDLGHNLRTFSC